MVLRLGDSVHEFGNVNAQYIKFHWEVGYKLFHFMLPTIS